MAVCYIRNGFIKRFRDLYTCILCTAILWIIRNVRSCMQILLHMRTKQARSMLITGMRWKRLHGISWTGEMLTNSFVLFINGLLSESQMNPERVKALYDICHAYQITTKSAEYEIHSCDFRRRNDYAEGALYGKRRKGISVCKDRQTGVGSKRRKALYGLNSL